MGKWIINFQKRTNGEQKTIEMKTQKWDGQKGPWVLTRRGLFIVRGMWPRRMVILWLIPIVPLVSAISVTMGRVVTSGSRIGRRSIGRRDAISDRWRRSVTKWKCIQSFESRNRVIRGSGARDLRSTRCWWSIRLPRFTSVCQQTGFCLENSRAKGTNYIRPWIQCCVPMCLQMLIQIRQLNEWLGTSCWWTLVWSFT